ncbi:unnamed protein product [Vitrella brassicaformis CCMP3155]|uniref:GB1/RHD3-type G domain-containing protein n=2 Tax=Vitrella brassicaformis TaxID=1169539 RepID=A0A0G4G7J7_VITBC|nr:unnamed protein product [Vitrella brassicaformis CCMP3155]|eukprot:CEM24662.1 unnamed protein product [Vitrella brassicaformis CCMP3155]
MRAALLLRICVSLASLVIACDASGEPLQLIYPDESHTQLLINRTNVDRLKQVPAPIAVVSVVGAIHSGKSFLLNQLLGERRGFELGYTVDPKTSGLWWWSEPIDVNGTSILFLDTEGFYGPNITADYDSKVFSVATLLSSEVVYNSVKLIDQNALDYLEFLTRRSQLFGVRAHTFANSSVADLVESLKPSGLTWVVQDFVQDLNGRSSRRWLEELIDNRNREGKNGSISDLFSRVDCVTLPPPSGDASALSRLDQADEAAFERAFVEEMRQFRERLIADASRFPKTKSEERKMSGADLADLVKFLVAASRSEDAQPKPPSSLWDQYAQLQVSMTKNDMLRKYETEIMKAINGTRPLYDDEFDKQHERVRTSVMLVFWRLTKGLEQYSKDASDKLKADIHKAMRSLQQQNCRTLTDHCERWKSVHFRSFMEQMDDIHDTLPLTPNALDKAANEARDEATAKLFESLRAEHPNFTDSQCCKSSLASFEQITKAHINEISRNNSRITQKAVDRAQARADKVFTEVKPSSLDISLDDLNSKIQGLSDASRGAFDSELGGLHGHPYMRDWRATLDKIVQKGTKTVEANWEKRCEDNAERKMHQLEHEFEGIIQKGVVFPVEDHTLKEHFDRGREAADAAFALLYCANSSAWNRGLRDLHLRLEQRERALDQRNVEALKDIVQVPLDQALAELKSAVSSYFIWWRFRKAAISTGERFIQAASAKSSKHTIGEALLPKVIDKWWRDDVTPACWNTILRKDLTLLGYLCAVIASIAGSVYFSRTGHVLYSSLFGLVGVLLVWLGGVQPQYGAEIVSRAQAFGIQAGHGLNDAMTSLGYTLVALVGTVLVFVFAGFDKWLLTGLNRVWPSRSARRQKPNPNPNPTMRPSYYPHHPHPQAHNAPMFGYPAQQAPGIIRYPPSPMDQSWQDLATHRQQVGGAGPFPVASPQQQQQGDPSNNQNQQQQKPERRGFFG